MNVIINLLKERCGTDGLRKAGMHGFVLIARRSTKLMESEGPYWLLASKEFLLDDALAPQI